MTNHYKEAIENLKKAILINADFKLEGLADLNSIKDTKEFKSLIALQKEWQSPVIHSEIAFTLKDEVFTPRESSTMPDTKLFI